jgi:hypothetical protein
MISYCLPDAGPRWRAIIARRSWQESVRPDDDRRTAPCNGSQTERGTRGTREASRFGFLPDLDCENLVANGKEPLTARDHDHGPRPYADYYRAALDATGKPCLSCPQHPVRMASSSTDASESGTRLAEDEDAVEGGGGHLPNEVHV